MPNLPGSDKQAGEQPQPFTVEDFGGLDTKARRPAIGPKDFYRLENWMPIGPGNMRTVYDHAEEPLYTAPGGRTILTYAFFNLGATEYAIVFLDNGTAYQVKTSDGAVTTISATASTFYDGSGALPSVSQFQAKYLMITSKVDENAYWAWDGTSLYTAGTLSPQVIMTNSGQGNGYSSAPTVTAYGGGGSGATFTAVLDGEGLVTDVTVTNPGSGYAKEDLVTLVFTGGGVSQDQARGTATVSTTTGGVAIVTVTGGGSNYSAPLVSFSGGGGSGAKAFVSGAANGVVTDITVTDPGSGYTSSPTVTITDSGGGSGSGATAIAEIRRGQITSVTINSGGSGYVGQPTVFFSAPNDLGFPSVQAEGYATVSAGAVTAVTLTNKGIGYRSATVQFSGGNDSAEAEIALMPFGISGTSIETYEERVWLADGPKILATAADSVREFSAAFGGVVKPVTDSNLREQVVALKQANGFLYAFGDSSIFVVSNVQTSTGGTTTFNFSNVDPQIGTAWRDSVLEFGRALVFGNPTGVYALFGGAAEKISGPLDGLFAKASFNTNQDGKTPSSFAATVFGIRLYGFLFTTAVPGSGNELRDVIACYDGQRWFLYTPTLEYEILAGQSINSVLTGWMATEDAIYRAFDAPSSELTKVAATKLVAPGSYILTSSATNVYYIAQDELGTGGLMSVSIDTEAGSNPAQDRDLSVASSWVNNLGEVVEWTNDLSAVVEWSTAGLKVIYYADTNYGQLLGATISTDMEDVTLISLTLLVRPDYSQLAG